MYPSSDCNEENIYVKSLKRLRFVGGKLKIRPNKIKLKIMSCEKKYSIEEVMLYM